MAAGRAEVLAGVDERAASVILPDLAGGPVVGDEEIEIAVAVEVSQAAGKPADPLTERLAAVDEGDGCRASADAGGAPAGLPVRIAKDRTAASGATVISRWCISCLP